MSIVKADPHPVVVTDPAGNTVDVVTSAPTAGMVGQVVYIAPSSAVSQVQSASEGPTNTAVPADATLIGGKDGSGKLQAAGIDANAALKTSNLGLSTINSTGQVSVNASTQIIAANPSRAAVMVTNTSPTVAAYWGNTGVTITTGQYLGPGLSVTIPVTAAIFGCAASAITLTFAELLP